MKHQGKQHIKQIFLLILGLFLFLGCDNNAGLLSHKGVLDLSGYDFETVGTIHLDGRWEYYQDKAVFSADVGKKDKTGEPEYILIPGRLPANKKEIGKNRGTCRLVIKMPQGPGDEYGLIIPRFVGSQNIWINGKKYISFDPDRSNSNRSGKYELSKQIFFKSNNREIELLIQCFNFYPDTKGVSDSIVFGKKSQIISASRRSRGLKFLLIGTLLIMSMYHLGFFMLQRAGKSTLYFALFNFAICLRTVLSDENLLFYFLPYNFGIFAIKFELVSVIFLAVFNILYFYHLFSDLANKKVTYTIIMVYLVHGLLTVVLPLRIVLRLTLFHIIINPLIFSYIVFIIIREIRLKREGARLYLAGTMALFISAIFDILKGQQLHHGYNMLPLGFFIFSLFQSILLGKRLLKAFTIIENFSARLEKEVAIRTLELERSHSTIMESINYARTIQLSILPRQPLLDTSFKELFILWSPRESVGGDLYWFKKRGEKNILALIDCTGHGVPGALMTMTVNSILSNIAESTDVTDPAQILQHLNTRLRTTLQKDSNLTLSDDGLDMGIVCWSSLGGKMIFSGAKISLFYLETSPSEDLKLIELHSDKQSIGYRDSDNTYIYTNYEIELTGNQIFYLTSDGLIDQCGGPLGLPFGKRMFKEVIEQNALSPLENQKTALMTVIDEYRKAGSAVFPQLDDVTVIGFKI